MKNIKSAVTYIFLTSVLAAATILGWRVDSLAFLNKEDEILFSMPMASGQSFTTTYIHSVELTPVEDEYRVLDGKIWQWQERVKSSNAGMPCFAPENGLFIRTDEWLIFQGGRKPWDRFYLRVGNERFGKNKLIIAPYAPSPLYRIFPGQRLTMTVTSAPLILSKSAGLGKVFNSGS